MGFYIRKSKQVGPFRLNLSKSGLGVSAGVKGFRVSTGPRGTYLNAGSGGLYYRKKIGSGKRPEQSNRNFNRSSNQNTSFSRIGNAGLFIFFFVIAVFVSVFLLDQKGKPISSNSLIITALISFIIVSVAIATSASPIRNADSYDDEVTLAIRKAQKSSKIYPVLLLLLVWGLYFLTGEAVGTGVLMVLFALIATIVAIIRGFVLRAKITYNLDDEETRRWNATCNALCLVKDSKNVWAFHAANYTANSILRYKVNRIRFVNPNKSTGINAVIDCTTLVFKSGNNKYVFLPDRLVVITGGHVKAFPYERITITKSMELTADKRLAKDSGLNVRSMRWDHETKDGSADLRYKNNRLSVKYELEAIELYSDMGVWFKFMMSKDHVRDRIVSSLEEYFRYAKQSMPLNWDFESEDEILPEEAQAALTPTDTDDVPTPPKIIDKTFLNDEDMPIDNHLDNDLVSDMLRFLSIEEDTP